jgi:hypothetical protein
VEVKVSAVNLSKWSLQKINKIYPLDLIFKSKKKVGHNGLLSQLKAIEDTLLRYIFELCDQGIIVNTHTYHPHSTRRASQQGTAL